MGSCLCSVPPELGARVLRELSTQFLRNGSELPLRPEFSDVFPGSGECRLVTFSVVTRGLCADGAKRRHGHLEVTDRNFRDMTVYLFAAIVCASASVASADLCADGTCRAAVCALSRRCVTSALARRDISRRLGSFFVKREQPFPGHFSVHRFRLSLNAQAGAVVISK